MKLQYLIIIVIFYFNSVASQEKNITVKFNVSLKEQYINPKASDDYKYFQKVMQKEVKEILPHLNFFVLSNRQSFQFTFERPMSLDNKPDAFINYATTLVFNGKSIYGNVLEKKSYYIPRVLEKTRMVDQNALNWKITDEKKDILGQECFKAYVIPSESYEDYDKYIPIYAWFAPNLNYQAGPTAYANLPGLILELETNLLKYTAVDLSLTKKKVEVINKENLDILSHKMFVQFYDEWNKNNRPSKFN